MTVKEAIEKIKLKKKELNTWIKLESINEDFSDEPDDDYFTTPLIIAELELHKYIISLKRQIDANELSWNLYKYTNDQLFLNGNRPRTEDERILYDLCRITVQYDINI